MEALLVINAGSSSLKFQIFGIATAGLERQVRAKLDGIATQPRLKATAADGTELINRRLDATAVPDLPEALSVARDWLATLRVSTSGRSATGWCMAVRITSGRC